MNTKKTWVIALVLFAAIIAGVFAQDAYADAYRGGYMAGYSASRKDSPVRGQSLRTKAVKDTHSMYGPTTDANRSLKAAHRDGYIQGWEDKANDVENRYL